MTTERAAGLSSRMALRIVSGPDQLTVTYHPGSKVACVWPRTHRAADALEAAL